MRCGLYDPVKTGATVERTILPDRRVDRRKRSCSTGKCGLQITQILGKDDRFSFTTTCTVSRWTCQGNR